MTIATPESQGVDSNIIAEALEDLRKKGLTYTGL